MNGGVSPPLLAAKFPGKDVHGALRRLVAGVARNIDALPEHPEDRVHDIRVGLKKFRAVLRLAEAALARPAFVSTDKLARHLKDHFGSARDNDVQRELLLDLLEKREALATMEALGFPEHMVPGSRAGDPSAREICALLSSAVDHMDLGLLTAGDVLGAWIAAYRGSRRAMGACRKSKNADGLFHEWRKQVKETLYQSAAIGPPLDSFVPKADRLASVLGSHHDLALLTERLAGCLPASKAARAAASRKRMVACRALAMGRKIFLERPFVLRRRFQKS